MTGRGEAHLPFFRIQSQEIFSLLLVADTKVVLAVTSIAVQGIKAFPFLRRMFIMFLKREVVNCAFDVREVCWSSREQSTLDQCLRSKEAGSRIS